ncbi:tetratricopeptide repeat (TPR)-like superfamily protein [Actinidia rufa]|uniref:Tetratricopeptide repeat (TPR)-like superfamily protein n=1 Tax=Actinidia rufa TaxID=165716 RepID=A0A7J0GYG3_9ERIC|nr:tetratricopeptide repeat (TPR)-like superfamily protein [Actinidia rufa]
MIQTRLVDTSTVVLSKVIFEKLLTGPETRPKSVRPNRRAIRPNRAAGVRLGLCGTQANYILLSNVYAAAERWDDASKVRNLMKAKGVSKVPGVSVIELKGIIHRFVAGDWSHPESHNIYEKLGQISTRLKTTSGYSPDTDQVLVDI